jgi:hypothetical protein
MPYVIRITDNTSRMNEVVETNWRHRAFELMRVGAPSIPSILRTERYTTRVRSFATLNSLSCIRVWFLRGWREKQAHRWMIHFNYCAASEMTVVLHDAPSESVSGGDAHRLGPAVRGSIKACPGIRAEADLYLWCGTSERRFTRQTSTRVLRDPAEPCL